MKRFAMILAGWAILGLATTTLAGTWSTSNWVNDASLTLTNSKTYTHAIDFAFGTTFGSQQAALINGVAFTQEIVSQGGFFNNSTKLNAGTDITTGNTWSLQYTNLSDGIYFGYSASAGFGPSGTESTKLKTAFTGAGNSFDDTFDWTLTLSGLQTNTTYLFTFFSSVFDQGGVRYADLDGLDDGVGNFFRVQQGLGGTNLQVQYTYNTGSNTTFVLQTKTSPASMFYAFANELVVIPEPSTWMLVGLGLLGSWWMNRRRRC